MTLTLIIGFKLRTSYKTWGAPLQFESWEPLHEKPKVYLAVKEELTRCLAVKLNFWSKNALGSICPGGLPIPMTKQIENKNDSNKVN